MRDLRQAMKQFNGFKGYFFADKKALNYLHQNGQDWNVYNLNGKMNVLGLNRLVPDYQLLEVQQLLAHKKVGQAVIEGDFRIFDTLLQDLSDLLSARFIVSKLLCAHKPDLFPIWDEQRILIKNWCEENRGISYAGLKQQIDDYMIQHEIKRMNYFYFNKLLWFCE